MITLNANTDAVLAHLKRIGRDAGDLTGVLMAIGEGLADSTKKRFDGSTAPDGKDWADNKASTLSLWMRENGGAKKPLIGNSKSLSTTIAYQTGHDEVTVGSAMVYAAVQQLGAKKGDLGSDAPWGDIPARPYLGVSDDDDAMIGDVVALFLSQLGK